MLKSKKFWGIVSSFFFLWLALRKVIWAKIPEILSTIQPHYIALIIFTISLEHITRAIRWRMLLTVKEFPLKTAYFGIILCYFFNNILPARAGEFFRAWYLEKKNITTMGKALASVVIERFLDGIVIITFMVYVLHKFKTNPLIEKASISAISFYVLILIAILLIRFRQNLFIRLTEVILRLLPTTLCDLLRKTRDSFIDGFRIFNKPVHFIKILGMSFFSWGISLLSYWLSLKMFSINFQIEQTMLLLVVIAIGSMIPASPGMIGVFQFCCVLILNGVFNYPEELAATFGITIHFISYGFVLLLGFSILSYDGLNSKFIKQASKEQFDISR